MFAKLDGFFSEQTGPVSLGQQMTQANFPKDYVLAKALAARAKTLTGDEQVRCLDTALLLASDSADS